MDKDKNSQIVAHRPSEKTTGLHNCRGVCETNKTELNTLDEADFSESPRFAIIEWLVPTESKLSGEVATSELGFSLVGLDLESSEPAGLAESSAKEFVSKWTNNLRPRSLNFRKGGFR